MANKEIYVSTDMEADGPIPGPYSMLSFGSAAYKEDKTLIDTFSVNLETLPGATVHPDTMEWWKNHPDAWEACRKDLQPPEKAMNEYVKWLESLPGIPVFVGYPAAYDFLFIHWYLVYFTAKNPFSHSALDIKTYAMALLQTPYRSTVKKRMPRNWFDITAHHKHIAIEDAIEQGTLFCNMLMERKKRNVQFR